MPSRAYISRSIGCSTPGYIADRNWLINVAHMTCDRAARRSRVNLKLARRLRQRLNRQKG